MTTYICVCVMQLISFTGNDLCCDGSCCSSAQSLIRGKTESIFTQEGAIARSVQMRVGCGGSQRKLEESEEIELGRDDSSGLLWLWPGCLISIVVSNLVFQLIIGQEVQGTSLHLNWASARTTGGETYGATTPAGGGQI